MHKSLNCKRLQDASLFFSRWLILITMILLVGCESMYTVENGYINVEGENYKFSFMETTGDIAYILDKTTDQQIVIDNKNNQLWRAVLQGGTSFDSKELAEQFRYELDEKEQKLVFHYTSDLQVTILIDFKERDGLYLQATVKNQTGKTMESFSLPNGLSVEADTVEEVLLPMMPGTIMNKSFFDANKSYQAQYPGIMFSDYVALKSSLGEIAVYGIHGDKVKMTNLGVMVDRTADGRVARLVHEYRTWVYDQQQWTSPRVAIHIGQDYSNSITAYRVDNGFDQFDSLTDKLGKQKQAFFESAMYKLDLHRIGVPFADLKTKIVDKLQVPGMIHPVAFQSEGHDQNYPNFIPPDPGWGNTDTFRDFTAYAKQKGNLVVPYTNFSWWDTDSELVKGRSEDFISQLAVDRGGVPVIERYGPHQGYVVNPHSEFVRNTIADQHRLLVEEVGMDGIFEDQWGARNAPYDFNALATEGGDPTTSYYEGVLAHYETNQKHRLMTEVGVDVLAEHGVGFMGTNYLWDLLGYRNETAVYTEYYPMIGMMARDKVLLYQHDLAAETWTDSKDMFRWNLAYGYNFSGEITSTASIEQHTWLDLIGVYQKYALSQYADELIQKFQFIEPKVSMTEFDSFTVYANWDQEKAYPWQGHNVAPGGAVLTSEDGSIVGGVFQTYNSKPLAKGDHYLLEVRTPEEVKLFQPVGSNTDISIKKPQESNQVTVVAYMHDGTRLDDIQAEEDGEFVSFRYADKLNGMKVGYYLVLSSK
jgi:hypothetical protein